MLRKVVTGHLKTQHDIPDEEDPEVNTEMQAKTSDKRFQVFIAVNHSRKSNLS
jgi:hypothetical protein